MKHNNRPSDLNRKDWLMDPVSRQNAALGPRIVAFLWDYVLISGYLILLTLVTIVAMQNADQETWTRFFSNPVRADLIAFFTTVLPVTLYFTFSERSSKQATWGKRKKALIVESTAGARLSFGKALARAFLKFLPWQIAHTCLFNIPGWPVSTESPPVWVVFGFVIVWLLVAAHIASIAFSNNNQAWYDRLLSIRVVSIR